MTTDAASLASRDWTEDYVGANGIRQHFWRTGGDGPVVIALPGFQEIGLTLARVARMLAPKFDVIMVDFRGQGRTELGDQLYSQALLTRDVAALLRALAVQRVSLLGFSNGAGVAAEFAATLPEMTACAVLEDPPRNVERTTGLGDSPQYRAWHEQWMGWLARFQAMSLDEQIEAVRQQVPGGASSWPNEELVAFAQSYAQLDPELVRDPGKLWSVRNRSIATLLPAISAPVLLMESTKAMPGPAPTPPTQVEVPANVTHVSFDTGHFIRRESFDRYMALVQPFLRRHAR